MKRLAFIVNSLGIGGAEKHTITLANSLIKMKYEITIFVLKNNCDLKEEVNKNIKIEFMEVNRFYDINTIKKIREICKIREIKQVFCVNSYPLLYGYNATKQTDIRCILIHHTTQLVGLKDKIKNIYFKRLMNKCDYRIFVSSNQRDYWFNKYNIKVNGSYVIRNGVNVNKFLAENDLKKLIELKDKLNISEDDLVIVCSAMFREEKNHIKLLEYINFSIKQNIKNIKLLLLGDGQKREEIESYIKTNGLEKFVLILGKQKDVREFYNISDIGILPSKAVETFSIAALEQMSMGIPMIMSNIGGANEMVIDGFNGYLYNLKDDSVVVNIINELANNKVKINKMGINAQNLIRSNFTEEKMIKNYINFIESI